MKKKCICIWIIICMFFSFTALAEDVRTIDWTDDSASSVPGGFLLLDSAGMQMYLPSEFTSFPLSDAEIADGLIAYCMTDDGERAIMVTFIPSLPEGLSDVEQVRVNGIDGLLAADSASDALCLLIPAENGRYIQFSFVPASDSDMKTLAELLVSSVCGADDLT